MADQAPSSSGSNFGPQLNAGGWSLVAIAGLFLGARIWAKLSGGRVLWWDDYVLVASWILFVANASVITYAIGLGFGSTNVPSGNIVSIAFSLSITAFLSALAAAWSKTSFAVMLLRITKGPLNYFVWAIIVTMNVSMTFAALLPFIQCTPAPKAWNPAVEGSCWSKNFVVDYGVFSAAYSAATDFILAIVSSVILMKLQMRMKEKIGVVVCMSLGALAGTTGIIRAVKVPLLRDFSSPSDSVELLIWTAVEISTTIMVASIPVLRIVIAKAVVSQRYKSFSRSRPNERYSRVGGERDKNRSHITEITTGTSQQHKTSGAGSPKSMNGIVRTETISVEYGQRDIGRALSVSLELEPMKPVAHRPEYF